MNNYFNHSIQLKAVNILNNLKDDIDNGTISRAKVVSTIQNSNTIKTVSLFPDNTPAFVKNGIAYMDTVPMLWVDIVSYINTILNDIKDRLN